MAVFECLKLDSSRALALLILAALIPGAVHAQTSAGQLLQEIQKMSPSTAELPEPIREISPSESKPAPPKPGQLTFVVKKFIFTGNSKLSGRELQVLTENFLNKPITFDDLQQVTDLITQHYRERGWLVRAVLPEQDITGGTITIRIVEAKFGGIVIDNQSKSVSTDRIERWIYGSLLIGDYLSPSDLDRALLTLNDLPDVAVVGSLQEGSKPGETNLLVTVTDKPLVNGQLAIDNFGDSNAGKVRESIQANLNGPLGIGDQVSVYGLYSEGSTYGRLSYSAPVGASGLRVGVNGSSMAYRVINQSFQSLYANGVANTGGIETSYPIIRSRPVNLVATGNWNYNEFKNWTISGINRDQTYNTSVAQAGLSGNALDNFLGGGLSVGSFVISAGEVNRSTQGQYNNYYGVAGNFAKFRYSFNRLQAVTDSLSAYVSVSGQAASKNMDSSEQLYLGGPLSVRAYGSGQGAASQGNLSTFELRQALPYETQLTAFYDLGNVQTWKFNNTTVNGVSNNYALQGYGLSLSWLGPYNTSVKGIWAQRSGQLSRSVQNYLNQNGGTSSNRFWITASVLF